MSQADDLRWLAATARLAGRGLPISRPNPAVGAMIVKAGQIIARGWTQAGGRPHAEAMALAAAGDAAAGATLYVSLEPCAHASPRGPACADLVAGSKLARLVVGCQDPDPRTAGTGMARIAGAGIATTLLSCPASKDSLAGYLMQRQQDRPYITLKLATSLDGCIALANGQSQWITSPEARAHTHALRAKSDAILVGGGTLRADHPRLDVRLPGLETRSPDRWVLTGGAAPDGWQALSSPQAVSLMTDCQYLFIEGGAQTAAAFLAANLVDRLVLYRAPIVIGGGLASIANIGLATLADAHNRWHLADQRLLGSNILEVYKSSPCSPA